VNKTNYIISRDKGEEIGEIPRVSIDNCQINSVTCSKFLGIVINEKTTWTDHIGIIREKIRQMLEYQNI
jgi:hypothetical protein